MGIYTLCFSNRYLYIFFSLSLLAGYNNVEVAEYLLERGADVNAQDKGGLIPLHNASSYGVSNLQLVVLVLDKKIFKIFFI